MPILTTDVGTSGDGCMPAPVISVATYGNTCIVSWKDIGADEYVVGLVRSDGLGRDAGYETLFDARYPDDESASHCGCPPSGVPELDGDTLSCDVVLPIIHSARIIRTEEITDPTPNAWTRYATRYRSNYLRCPTVTGDVTPLVNHFDGINAFMVNRNISNGSNVADKPSFANQYTLEPTVPHRRGLYDTAYVNQDGLLESSVAPPTSFEFKALPHPNSQLISDGERGCVFNYQANQFSLYRWYADPPSWAEGATPTPLAKHSTLINGKPEFYNRYIPLPIQSEWRHYWQKNDTECPDSWLGVESEDVSFLYQEDDIYAPSDFLNNVELGKRKSTTRVYKNDVDDRPTLAINNTLHDGYFQQDVTDPLNIKLINPLYKIGDTWRFKFYMFGTDEVCVRVQGRYTLKEPYLKEPTEAITKSYIALSEWSNPACMNTGSFAGSGGSHFTIGKSEVSCILWCGKDSLPFPPSTDGETIYVEGDLFGNLDDLLPLAPGVYDVQFGFKYDEEYKDDDGVVLETVNVTLPPSAKIYRLIVPEYPEICENGFYSECQLNGDLISYSYDPNACEIIDKTEVCSVECDCAEGCTDPTACNYDPTATNDDGSCILPEAEGYSPNYCLSGDIWRDYSSGGCNPTTTPELVQSCTCPCGSGATSCPSTYPTGWIGNPFCYLGDLYRSYRSNQCSSSTTNNLYQNCDCGCVLNSCVDQIYVSDGFSYPQPAAKVDKTIYAQITTDGVTNPASWLTMSLPNGSISYSGFSAAATCGTPGYRGKYIRIYVSSWPANCEPKTFYVTESTYGLPATFGDTGCSTSWATTEQSWSKEGFGGKWSITCQGFPPLTLSGFRINVACANGRYECP